MNGKLLVFSVVLLSVLNIVLGHMGDHNQPQPQHQQHHSDPMHSNINKDHIYEHLDGVINKPKDQMTVEEQNFYYFKLHDYDNNNMLDGLELVSAFAHNEGKHYAIFSLIIY